MADRLVVLSRGSRVCVEVSVFIRTPGTKGPGRPQTDKEWPSTNKACSR